MTDLVKLFEAKSGWALSLENNDLIWTAAAGSYRLMSVRLDAGVDGAWVFDSMPFESYEDFRTWTLPALVFSDKPASLPKPLLIKEEERIRLEWLSERLC